MKRADLTPGDIYAYRVGSTLNDTSAPVLLVDHRNMWEEEHWMGSRSGTWRLSASTRPKTMAYGPAGYLVARGAIGSSPSEMLPLLRTLHSPTLPHGGPASTRSVQTVLEFQQALPSGLELAVVNNACLRCSWDDLGDQETAAREDRVNRLTAYNSAWSTLASRAAAYGVTISPHMGGPDFSSQVLVQQEELGLLLERLDKALVKPGRISTTGSSAPVPSASGIPRVGNR